VILYLFLSHLAVGIFLSLLLVSKEAGVKFFRFNAGMVVTLVAVAVAFRPADDVGMQAQVGYWSLLVSGGATVLYWGTIGRMLASVRPAIVGIAAVGGLVSVVAQALAASAATSPATQALTIASFLTSVGLLGGACTAMVLGHWYLVLPGMEVSHLQSIIKVHIVSMVLRVAVVMAAIVFAIGTYEPGLGLPSFKSYIWSVSGVFFWQRMLFGLAGPALLSYLTWETAKIRSTQSATGILYVDFFTVVVGEVLSKYLMLVTHVPV
jgi:protein NrfD